MTGDARTSLSGRESCSRWPWTMVKWDRTARRPQSNDLTRKKTQGGLSSYTTRPEDQHDWRSSPHFLAGNHLPTGHRPRLKWNKECEEVSETIGQRTGVLSRLHSHARVRLWYWSAAVDLHDGEIAWLWYANAKEQFMEHLLVKGGLLHSTQNLVRQPGKTRVSGSDQQRLATIMFHFSSCLFVGTW